MLSEQARNVIEEALIYRKNNAQLAAVLHKDVIKTIVDEVDAALAELRALSQPLDAPDAPGWWAWEGYINYARGCDPTRIHREVVRVYWGSVSQQWQVVREHGRHPAYMLVGKWYRLTMPWEVQP